MSKVNEGSMKQWMDGETIHAAEYNNERTLIVRALNDTDKRVDTLATDMRAPFSVISNMIADGAVTPSKVVEGTITQYSYTKAETDQHIANALADGLPQSVIDSIVAGATQTVSNHANDQLIHVTEAKQAKWDGMLPKTGGEMTGSVVSKNTLPLISKWTTKKTWAMHHSENNFIYISPSMSNDGSDWDFTQGIAIMPTDLQWGGGRRLSTSQHSKVTQDNGYAININNQDLNNIKTTGFYSGFALGNAPSADWYYLEVIQMSDPYVLQNLYDLNASAATYRQRKLLNGTWTAWSPDVFQSGVDAKQGIVTALNARGIASNMNHPWGDLALHIGQISAGSIKVATGTLSVGGTSGMISNLPFAPKIIVLNCSLTSTARTYDPFQNTSSNAVAQLIAYNLGSGVVLPPAMTTTYSISGSSAPSSLALATCLFGPTYASFTHSYGGSILINGYTAFGV